MQLFEVSDVVMLAPDKTVRAGPVGWLRNRLEVVVVGWGGAGCAWHRGGRCVEVGVCVEVGGGGRDAATCA